MLSKQTQPVLTALVLGFALAFARPGGPVETQCVYVHAHFVIDIAFSSGTPNESQVRAFVLALDAEPNWSATVERYSSVNWTSQAVVGLASPPAGPVRHHAGTSNLWALEGVPADQATLELQLLGGEDRGNGSAIVAELRAIAKAQADWLGGRLAVFLGEAKVRETVTDSVRGGCCPTC